MAAPHDSSKPPARPAQATNNSNAKPDVKSTSDSDSSATATTPSIPIAQRKPAPASLPQSNPFAIDPYDGKPAVWPRDPSGARIGGRVTFLSSMRTWEEAWGLKRGGERGRGGSEMGGSGRSGDGENRSLRTGTVRGGFRAGFGGFGGFGGMRGGRGRGVSSLDMEKEKERDAAKEAEKDNEKAKDKLSKTAKQKQKEKQKEREKETEKASSPEDKDKSTQDKKSWLPPPLRRPPQASETQTQILTPPNPTHHATPRHPRTRNPAHPSQTPRGSHRSGPVSQLQDGAAAWHDELDHDGVRARTFVRNGEKEKKKEKERELLRPTDGRDRPESPNYDPFTYSAFPFPAALLPAPITLSIPTPCTLPTPSTLPTPPTPSPSPPKTAGPTTWLSGLKTRSKATTAVFDELFSFGAAVKRRPETLSPGVSPRSSLEGATAEARGGERVEEELEGGLGSSASGSVTGPAILIEASTAASPVASPAAPVPTRSDSTCSSTSSFSTSSTRTITASSPAPSPHNHRIDSSSPNLSLPFSTTPPAHSPHGHDPSSVKTPQSSAMKGYDVMGMLDCERPDTTTADARHGNEHVHPGQRVDFGAVGCDFLFAAPPEGTLRDDGGLVPELSPGLGLAPDLGLGSTAQRNWDADSSLEYHGWLHSSQMAAHRRSSFPTAAAAGRWGGPGVRAREGVEVRGRIEVLDGEDRVVGRGRGACGSEAARRVCEGRGQSSGTLVAVAAATTSSSATVPRPSASLSTCIVAAPAPESVPMLRSRSDPCTEAFLTHIRASLEARRLAALRYPVFADEAQRGFWVDGPL